METTALRRRAVPMILMALAVTVAACQSGNLSSTSADISTREAVLDLGQNLVDLREENAMLQAQIDSIRGVVAYQDSILRMLAGAAGLQMRPQSAPMP
jgi:hypothetical protein